MISLGDFRFKLNTAAYQTKERTTAYRWGQQDILTDAPQLQFVGQGVDSMNLSGVVYPFYKGGLGQIDKMREIAGKGEELKLIDGGDIQGFWVIEEISETQTIFNQDGSPQKIEFSLSLKKARGEESPGYFALNYFANSWIGQLA